MMKKKQVEYVLDILQKENIRLVDGRYSGGFIDTEVLHYLIRTGEAETYMNEIITFVRLKRKKI